MYKINRDALKKTLLANTGSVWYRVNETEKTLVDERGSRVYISSIGAFYLPQGRYKIENIYY
jgi:hypothetical protein